MLTTSEGVGVPRRGVEGLSSKRLKRRPSDVDTSSVTTILVIVPLILSACVAVWAYAIAARKGRSYKKQWKRALLTAALTLTFPTAATARNHARYECTIYSGNPLMAMVILSAKALARAYCIHETHAIGPGTSWTPGIKRFSVSIYPVCGYRTTSAYHSPITVTLFTTRANVGIMRATGCTSAIWKPSAWMRVS